MLLYFLTSNAPDLRQNPSDSSATPTLTAGPATDRGTEAGGARRLTRLSILAVRVPLHGSARP
jgi:hypothetical protein